VRRFAQDVVGPKVREMDEKEHMDPVGRAISPSVETYLSRKSSRVFSTME